MKYRKIRPEAKQRMWKWTAQNLSTVRDLLISYILTFTQRDNFDLGDIQPLNLKTNFTNASTNQESKRAMYDALDEIIFIFRYKVSNALDFSSRILRSELCISYIQEIDTKSESRISTAWDWVKFVDRIMDKIDNIDPKHRSEKEKLFRKVCFRKQGRQWYFLGIAISKRDLRDIENRVSIKIKKI